MNDCKFLGFIREGKLIEVNNTFVFRFRLFVEENLKKEDKSISNKTLVNLEAWDTAAKYLSNLDLDKKILCNCSFRAEISALGSERFYFRVNKFWTM